MLDVRNDRQVANLLGIVFIIVGILGFVPNPLVGPEGIFMTNVAHNILHALVGVMLMVSAKMGHGKPAILIFGIVYILLAILGYAMMSDMMFGVVAVNMADHYLHLLLGIVVIAAGVYVKPAKA